ncbi:MAG: hypothetical protein WHX60_16185 [Armatimonadota bacterium]
MERFRVAVDFDGTLVPVHYVYLGEEPKPYPTRVQALRELSNHFNIYIFTSRDDLEEAERVLAEHGIKKGVHYLEITRTKGPFWYLIDDAAGNETMLDDPATAPYRIGQHIHRVLKKLWPYLRDGQKSRYRLRCENSNGAVAAPQEDEI